MDAGAGVFAELAPQSGRFTAGALVRLLDQVDTVTADVTGMHEVLLAAGGGFTKHHRVLVGWTHFTPRSTECSS